jgi:hypothetical protein
MQPLLLMEQICATKLMLGKNNMQKNQFLPLFFIPFTTELPEVAEVLRDVKICKCAMMAVLQMRRAAWSTCKEPVDSGSNPQHGIKGQKCARSKQFKIQVEPSLKEFYTSVVLPLSGPLPTHSTRQQSGAADAEEDLEDDFTELDPEWTKRQLFGCYCWDLGFLVTKGSTMEMNVVMDNCAGQNKNNYVLRLAPYLIKKGYFQEVHFIFLVVGHTKNVTNHLFNILKKLYRHQNIFTMGMMMKAMSHELTIPYLVDWQVFKNWDKFLNRLCKANMSSVKK